MKNINFKQFLPHFVAVLIFISLSAIYFYPALEGYRIQQSDIKLSKGMSQEIRAHRAEFDEEPLWLGNMFSGMPAFQVSVLFPSNLAMYLNDIIKLGLPGPVAVLFAYMIGFFIFGLSLRINPWVAMVGAIAYGFSSYFIIILEVGHNTKAMALAYLPPMLAGIITLYRGKEILGFILTVIFLGLELYANHFQITYYSILIIIGIAVLYLIKYLKENNLKLFFKRSIFLILAALLGVGLNFGNLYTTYEYSKSSTRSKSELTIQPDGNSNEKYKSSGLDKDYITRWSYGKQETMSLFLSNIKGGGTGAIIGSEEEVERLRKENPRFFSFLVQQYQENQNIINTYWGNQPFTSGPVYIGIIVFVLAILSFFFVKKKLVIMLGVISVFAILLAWGKNFMGLTDFFIDYIPLYNKFRAVTMLLIIVEFTLPALAILFISKLYENRDEILEKKKKLIYVGLGIFVVLGFLWLTPESFLDFTSNKEITQFNKQSQNSPNIKNSIDLGVSQLVDYRVEIVKNDVLRALKYLIILFLILTLYLYKRINRNMLVLGIGVLIVADLWSVDKQYFDNEKNPNAGRNKNNKYVNYELPENKKSPYVATRVDQAIFQTEVQKNPEIVEKIESEISEKQNTKGRLIKAEIEKIQFNVLMRNTHYRVLNTTSKLDEDAGTAYFHKTLGGYHAAKMKKYQELIDFQLGKEYFQLRQIFMKGGVEQVKNYLPQMKAVNMLNTRYVIGAINTEKGQQLTYVNNPFALGNAWFVENIKMVDNADEEILAVQEFNPKETAIVRKDEQPEMSLNYKINSSDRISLTNYLPNELRYSYNISNSQFAVFSETFYDDGWKVYINGDESSFIKVNYILRGMELPKGSGEIVFKFNPTSYKVGETVSLASSILLVLLILGAIYKNTLKNKNLQ